MRFFKQIGMAAAARSASGSVNAKWMPGLLPSIPTGSGIGGYHTLAELERYYIPYSEVKKVLEANVKGGVVHECSYEWEKRAINVVPCFEIPKIEKEEEKLDMVLGILVDIVSAIEALYPPIPHKLLSKVTRENFMRVKKKGAVLHAYEFSWREGVKLTPILNLNGRARSDLKCNIFRLTFKITPVLY